MMSCTKVIFSERIRSMAGKLSKNSIFLSRSAERKRRFWPPRKGLRTLRDQLRASELRLASDLIERNRRHRRGRRRREYECALTRIEKPRSPRFSGLIRLFRFCETTIYFTHFSFGFICFHSTDLLPLSFADQML